MAQRLNSAGLRALLSSPKWREFERSLADGMRVSLSICCGPEWILAPGTRCPWCQGGADGRGECRGYVPRALAVVGEPVVVTCERGIPHAVCHLAGDQILDVVYLGPVAGAAADRAVPGLPEISAAELQAKARSVRTIIAGFVMAHVAATAWGRRGLEMAAIREISRTIVSLLRFGNPELDKALDLILNSLLILLDADGCWLETSDGLVIARGVALDAQRRPRWDALAPEGVVECPIGQDGELGRLGVHRPADREWAEEVLAQLGNQAQIVLEVDRLHRTAQHQMGMLLEALDGAVLITDRLGRIKFANSSAERLLRRRAPDLFGHDADAVLPVISGAVRHALAQGRRHEGLGQTAIDGRELRLEWSAAPFLDAGAIAGCLVVMRDRTAVHDQHRQLLELQHLSPAGQMAAGVAREIHHPLAAVRGLLERLAGQAGSQPACDLTRALAALDRARAVIDVFLQLAQTGSQVRGPVDLVQLVCETAAHLAPAAELQGVRLRVQTSGAVLPVWGNADEFREVLHQLCRNALQAMPDGGDLLLRADGAGQWVTLRVVDTGAGIPPDNHLGRVCEPFFTTRPGGLGLGLFLSRAIARAHGGRLHLRSRAGAGTAVSLRLPALAGDGGVQLLLVTPDPMLRTLVETAADGSAIPVLTLSAGETVAAGVCNYRPAVVVLDLRLGEAWREVAATVRRARPSAAVVLLAEAGSDQVLAEAHRLGIPYHLEHPVDPAALLALVRRLLGTGGTLDG